MFHFTDEAHEGLRDEPCAQGHTCNYGTNSPSKRCDGGTHILDHHCARASASLFRLYVVVYGVLRLYRLWAPRAREPGLSYRGSCCRPTASVGPQPCTTLRVCLVAWLLRGRADVNCLGRDRYSKWEMGVVWENQKTVRGWMPNLRLDEAGRRSRLSSGQSEMLET